jgi:UDP-N-acetylglucosamine 2-epimerase (non-hydrolysing)
MKRILFFFGTRPEAIKMAPVVQTFARDKRFRTTLAVSAQHRQMLDQVFGLFRLRANVDLNLMRPGQSLSGLTTRVLNSFEPVLERAKPDLVVVHGDTTTTFAGALAAFYKKIPVAHVEAGLRTHDIYQPFPEEINRRMADAVSVLHFAPTETSRRNLLTESAPRNGLFVTGNTVIDALYEVRRRIKSPTHPKLRNIFLNDIKHGKRFVFMTAHRRENFGRPLEDIFLAVRFLAKKYPDVHWVYPVHPNPNVTSPAKRILSGIKNIHLLPPLGYSDAVWLIDKCAVVLTDSGGLQEEAPALGKPVLVLRDVTERPEAVVAGTVKLVGSHSAKIISAVSTLLTNAPAYAKMANAVNPYGDGRLHRNYLITSIPNTMKIFLTY